MTVFPFASYAPITTRITISLDCTKANASKYKALSWKYANALEQQLKREMAELMCLAEQADNT